MYNIQSSLSFNQGNIKALSGISTWFIYPFIYYSYPYFISLSMFAAVFFGFFLPLLFVCLCLSRFLKFVKEWR